MRKQRLVILLLVTSLAVNLCSAKALGYNAYADDTRPFYKSGLYEYQINADGESATLVDFTQEVSGDELVLPVDIDGYKVTGYAEKGKHPYVNYLKVKKVVVSDSYLGIGESAFSEKTELEEVIIGKNVRRINYRGFYACENLKKVEIQSKNIELESGFSMGNEDEEVFAQCKNLKEVIFAKGIKKIPAKTFKDCKKLSNLKLPSSVEYLDYAAFENCDSLKIINLSNIEVLGDCSFLDCDGLKRVVIPGTVRKQMDYKAKVNVDEDYSRGSSADIGKAAFMDCDKLKTVVIQQGAGTIGIAAFKNCKALKTITIPKSVHKIGKNAIPKNGGKTIIKGYKGSYAEKYAKKKGIKFKAI